jgi:hypothetical protein
MKLSFAQINQVEIAAAEGAKQSVWTYFATLEYGSSFLSTCGLHVGVSVNIFVVGLAYQGKDIVFRFIIEYTSLRDFGPY